MLAFVSVADRARAPDREVVSAFNVIFNFGLGLDNSLPLASYMDVRGATPAGII